MNNSRLHLSAICDQWLQLNRTKVRESSYVKYCAIINKHIKPALGGYLIQAIDSLTIEQFSYTLLTKNALAPKTVRDILSLLKTVLQYAHKTVSGIVLLLVCEIKKEPTVSFQNDWLRGQQKSAGSVCYYLPSLYCIQLLLGFVSIFKGKKPFFHLRI